MDLILSTFEQGQKLNPLLAIIFIFIGVFIILQSLFFFFKEKKLEVISMIFSVYLIYLGWNVLEDRKITKIQSDELQAKLNIKCDVLLKSQFIRCFNQKKPTEK